jgi:hypothetical protein
VSILKATHREPECSAVVEQVGIAAAEEEAARTGAANRTAPIAAVGTNIEERPRAAVAVARHGQLKRGSKGSCAVVATPT